MRAIPLRVSVTGAGGADTELIILTENAVTGGVFTGYIPSIAGSSPGG